LEGGGADETLGVVGHGHLHAGSGVPQPADQHRGLVGGDATTYAQQDLLVLEGWHLGVFLTPESTLSLPDAVGSAGGRDPARPPAWRAATGALACTSGTGRSTSALARSCCRAVL